MSNTKVDISLKSKGEPTVNLTIIEAPEISESSSSLPVINFIATGAQGPTGVQGQDGVAEISTGQITSDHLSSSSVGEDEIANGSVTYNKLAASSVRGNRISSSAITSSKIANGAVTQSKLGQNSVGTDQIINGTITAELLQDLTIIGDKLEDLGISTGKLQDLIITTAKLRDRNVTGIKIAENADLDGEVKVHNLKLKGYSPAVITGPDSDALHIKSNETIDFLNSSGVTIATLDQNGNLSISGTVDGRDIASDGIKLDGIADNEIIDWTVNQGEANIDPGNYTDTIYTHPSSHPISLIAGLQTALNLKQDAIGNEDLTIQQTDGLQEALDAKVDDSQVLTNVPANAVFTDTNTQLTQEQVEDYAGDLIENGTKTGITVTYDDNNDAINMVVDHDTATNFVAEEHYRWDNDIQSTATINHLNLSLDTPAETEVLVINDGDAVWGHGEKIHIQIRNDEGSTISAGQPLYSKGEIGGSNRILVGVCDANDSTKMPCIGIAHSEMNTTSTKDNFAVVSGIYNTNISGFTSLSVGNNLYIQDDGSLSQTKPTGETSLIQNVAIVLRTNGSTCQGMLVSAIGRTNDVPNLNSGYVFYGNGSNQAVSTQLSTLLPPDLTVDGAGTVHSNNYTDTVYTHPANHAISVITGLQSALDAKVDDSQVLTNVPANAVFTDTNTTYSIQDGELSQNNFTDADHTKLNNIEDNATADQTKADIDALGIAATTAVSLTAGNKTIDGSLDIGSNQAGHDLNLYGANLNNATAGWVSSANLFKFTDSTKLGFGTGNQPGAVDSSIQANGSNLVITNTVGNIQIGDTVEITGNLTTTGDIELGHASDTTIARSAAGTVTIEGNTIATTNKLIDTKVAAYWSSSTGGFYVPLSGATFSENTSLSTASYALMYIVPYDGKILRISSFHQNAASGTSTFEVYIDGDDSDLTNDQRGSDMTTSSFTRKFTEDCPTDWTFSKGEAIAIKRTDSVARYGVTMTVVFEFDTTT